MILGFQEYESQGRRLADTLDRSFALVDVHRFPDGETRITLPPRLPRRLIVCRSLNQPNDKLIDLLLVAETARELGVEQLTLVAPYLCYMRQDMAFRPGEAVSQRIIGQLLGRLFDAVVTVDPHLHRVARLDEAVPAAQALALSCAPAMALFLKKWSAEIGPLLVGPDSESEQWVRAIAQSAGLDYAVCSKRRSGDHEVEVLLPRGDFRGRDIVLVDDIASTGNTLIAVAKELKSAGAGRIHCLITHALFSPQTAACLQEAGIENIWSSDSITHATNAVPLAPLLADALERLTPDPVAS